MRLPNERTKSVRLLGAHKERADTPEPRAVMRAYLRRLEEQGRLLRVGSLSPRLTRSPGSQETRTPAGPVRAGAGVRPSGWLATCSAARQPSPIISAWRPAEIIPRMLRSHRPPSAPADCRMLRPARRWSNLEPDLDELPILRHCEQDGGNYISSGGVDRPPPALRAEPGLSPLHAVLEDRDGGAGGAAAGISIAS